MLASRRLCFSALLASTLACSGKSAGSSDNPPGGNCQVNCAPEGAFTAHIVRPNGNISVLAGDNVDFEAEFFDSLVRVAPPTLSWTASPGGFLGSANPLNNQQLTAGAHTVTVSGTLAAGQSAQDSVIVTVGDIAVEILNPDAGDTATVSNGVRFQGTARVPDTANPGATVTLISGVPVMGERQATFAWTSDRDGAFASSNGAIFNDDFVYTALSVGTHRITLTVSDDLAGGSLAAGSASITLKVNPPNTPPQVAITTPAVCPVDLEAGQTLMLTATATDAEDGALTGSWRKSVSGNTTSGNSLSFSSAAVGKHQLVFSATDSLGVTREAVCDVFVIAVGGSRADLFPDSGAINGALAGGNDTVRFIGADGGGNTLIGNDVGLTIFDAGATLIDAWSGPDLGVSGGDAVVNAAAATSDALFVATDQGLARCDYAAGVASACVQLSGDAFTAVVATGAGPTLLAAASNAGLYVASLTGATVDAEMLFAAGNSNLPTDQVFDVLFLDGVLYVATNDGLCIADDVAGALADPGNVELCGAFLDDGNSILPANEIFALAAGADEIWLGTADGLALYDTTTGAITAVYDQDSGLADNRVNDVWVDLDGIVWVASDDGVSRLDPATGSVTIFTAVDFGLPAGTNFNAVFIDANGVKWFGTDSGVVRYDGV